MNTKLRRQILLACGLLLTAFCLPALGQGGTGKLPPPRKLPPPIRNPPIRRDPPTRMPDLRISERRVGDVIVLDLNGKVTSREGGKALRNAIRRLVSDDKKKILLNLAKVSSIDASEAKEMVSIHSSVEKEGGQLKLCSLTRKVRDQLARNPEPGVDMGFGHLGLMTDTFEKEQDALANFR